MQTLYSKVGLLLWTEIPILVYTDIDVVAIFVVVVVVVAAAAVVAVLLLLLLCLFVVVFSPALRSRNGIAKSSYSIIFKFLVLVQQ